MFYLHNGQDIYVSISNGKLIVLIKHFKCAPS
jgi:hypothetical protein